MLTSWSGLVLLTWNKLAHTYDICQHIRQIAALTCNFVLTGAGSGAPLVALVSHGTSSALVRSGVPLVSSGGSGALW